MTAEHLLRDLLKRFPGELCQVDVSDHDYGVGLCLLAPDGPAFFAVKGDEIRYIPPVERKRMTFEHYLRESLDVCGGVFSVVFVDNPVAGTVTFTPIGGEYPHATYTVHGNELLATTREPCPKSS